MKDHPHTPENPSPDGDDIGTIEIVSLAAKCVDFFGARFDGFDYSEASLAVVEELLGEASDYFQNMDRNRQEQIVQQVGSYVLEVARRNFGGQYFWYNSRNQPILVIGLPDFEVSLLAWDKVRGRLSNGPEDNIEFFFKGYAERVRNAKPGDKAQIV
jgi:hypothetical protein